MKLDWLNSYMIFVRKKKKGFLFLGILEYSSLSGAMLSLVLLLLFTIDSSLIQYTPPRPVSFPSIPPSLSTHLPSHPDPLPLHFRKKAHLQETTAKDDTIIQGKSPHNKVGQDNSIRAKEPQVQVKESETSLLLLLGVPPKHQANSHSLYSENLVAIHAGPVLAASVSVRPCDPCLADLMNHILLLSAISESYSSFSSSSSGFSDLGRKGFNKITSNLYSSST